MVVKTTRNLSIPTLRMTILGDVRFRGSHTLKWLTLDPGLGEDCIAPDVEDVIVEELENEGKHREADHDPDEVVGVVVQVTVPDDLGGEPEAEEDDELDEVEEVEHRLPDEGGNVETW